MIHQENTGHKSLLVFGKYPNMIYGDFCIAASRDLRLNPIDMGYGDPAAGKLIPKELLKCLTRQLRRQNAGAYPDIKGDKALIEKFKAYIKNDEDLSYDYDLAIVSGGGRSAITNILSIFLKPKDIVLIPYPAWGGYKSSVKFLDVIIYPIPTTMKTNFVPSADDIRSSIAEAQRAYPQSNVRMMILTTPHNPTGAIYSSNAIREILKVLREHKIFCLADYTYRAIRDKKFPVPSVHKIAEEMEFEERLPKGTLTDIIVAMQTLGKISLTPGLRIGYVAATNPAIIDDFCVKKQAFDFSGSLFVQKALAGYLLTKKQENEFKKAMTAFDSRRSVFVQRISDYGYTPENRNIIINEPGFYISFEIPRRYQKKYPIEQLDNLLKEHSFIEKSMDVEEYKSWFNEKGYVPASEIFVLELIKNTGINMLPGHLFCPANKEHPNEYENWARAALIPDKRSIVEAFHRIERNQSLFRW